MIKDNESIPNKSFLWKIGGEAGFGIMTAGLTFSKIAARAGYHIFDYNEYPSLIRGGHNTYEVRISPDPIFSSKEQVDLLVCLNKETFEHHKNRLVPQSIVVYDSEEFDFSDTYVKVAVPFRRILKEAGAQYMMANTVAQGVTLALLGGEIEWLLKIIEKDFARKGQEVVDYNTKFAKLGFELVRSGYSSAIRPILRKRSYPEQVVLFGNDAFSLGAVIADCRLYAAYPMTPTSQVLATLAGWQQKTGMVVRHAEDEISVINTALGSSFGGARSAVGTSGGGFALMVETLSYAGVAEIPIVVFLGMRPGPATGLPTWTEQGDLLFAAHAGHGEFPKIVLAPGDTGEMLKLTAKAFDLADIYQTPVIVIADKFLCEAHGTINKDFFENFVSTYQVRRGKTIEKTTSTPYLRYEVTPDGISPRLIPGQKGLYYQDNSYEHDETGHTTESAVDRVAQVDKRNRKWQTYLSSTDYQGPQIIGDMDAAHTVFVSWGANKGPIVDAQKILALCGHPTAFIYFNHVYPIKDADLPDTNREGKRYILVENNSHGQFGQLLRQQTGIEIKEKLLKYDGRPFWPEEIANYVLTKTV